MAHTWGATIANYDRHLRTYVSEQTRRSRVQYARRVADLAATPADVDEHTLVGMLAEHRTAWTRSTYFGHMRCLCSYLVRAGVLDVDPTDTMRRPANGRPAPRPLTPVEVDRALGEATTSTRHLLLLGLLAGLRASEAAGMHSSMISEFGLTVTGKGGKTATLPAHPRLVEIAAEYPGYWFPGRGGHAHVLGTSVSERVSWLFGRLGIEGSFHRCRHYYGTSLLRAGVNIRVIQELMRHSSLATTAAYLGVDEDEKRAAVLALVA